MIGDRAADMLTTAIERAYRENPKPDPRFRMIHMSLLNEDIISRIADLPVVLDIQPMFVSTNVRWSESRVGHERSRYHYCWRTLLDNNMILTAGSDSPCESYDPMDGIYVLTEDIDLRGEENPWESIGYGGKFFTGTFDGAGHTISGLYLNFSSIDTYQDQGLGLFTYVRQGGTVKLSLIHI